MSTIETAMETAIETGIGEVEKIGRCPKGYHRINNMCVPTGRRYNGEYIY